MALVPQRAALAVFVVIVLIAPHTLAQSAEQESRIKYERAKRAIEKSDYATAVPLLESVLEELGPFSEVLYYAALASRHSGQIGKAQSFIDDALAVVEQGEDSRLIELAAEVQTLMPMYELAESIHRNDLLRAEKLLASGVSPDGTGLADSFAESSYERHQQIGFFLQPLLTAVAEKNVSAIKILVQHGADPWLAIGGHTSPVQAACRGDEVRLVEPLLEKNQHAFKQEYLRETLKSVLSREKWTMALALVRQGAQGWPSFDVVLEALGLGTVAPKHSTVPHLEILGEASRRTLIKEALVREKVVTAEGAMALVWLGFYPEWIPFLRELAETRRLVFEGLASPHFLMKGAISDGRDMSSAFAELVIEYSRETGFSHYQMEDACKRIPQTAIVLARMGLWEKGASRFGLKEIERSCSSGRDLVRAYRAK